MERLTCKFDEEEIVLKGCCTFDRESTTEPDDCQSCEEICQESGGDCEKCEIQKAINKLSEYEDLEEQGLLQKLPVAKGSSIYPLLYANGKPRYIDELEVAEISDRRIWAGSTCFDYEDIGKTVFLTREQAEQALEKQLEEP